MPSPVWNTGVMMVSIVTGTGTGLQRSSGFVLGSGGQIGTSVFNRYGENITVNAANGNLIINRTDEILVGQGPDDILTRTYNSQFDTAIDADRWWMNVQRRISGQNGDGTVTLYDWDGSNLAYTRDASGVYICTQAGLEYHRLSFANNVWTWTDGRNGTLEAFDSTGRILSSKDADGNTLLFDYSVADQINIRTANGEYLKLVYSGGNLSRVETYDSSNTKLLTRVSYGYESNRLVSVTTDLTPEITSDNQAVTTTYTYYTVGDSDAAAWGSDLTGSVGRIKTISQTGGAYIRFLYDASSRVKSFTQTVEGEASRTTTITYGSGSTQIVDAEDNTWILNYDSAGQLTRVDLPTGKQRFYSYTVEGELSSVTDGNAHTTTNTYYSNGDLHTTTDALGNSVTYTWRHFNSTNGGPVRRIETETHTPGANQGGTAATIRNLYDAEGHCLYTISGMGEVTEYRYDSAGNRTAAITYMDSGALYAIGNLASNQAPTPEDVDSWYDGLTAAVRNNVQRTDYAYGPRGTLLSSKSYKVGDSTNTQTGEWTGTYYVYDTSGNLISRQTAGYDGTTNKSLNTETWTYDGLWRITMSTDQNGLRTDYIYRDAINQSEWYTPLNSGAYSDFNTAGELRVDHQKSNWVIQNGTLVVSAALITA